MSLENKNFHSIQIEIPKIIRQPKNRYHSQSDCAKHVIVPLNTPPLVKYFLKASTGGITI